jgi:GNAT superfamily N-acetyltransferase
MTSDLHIGLETTTAAIDLIPELLDVHLDARAELIDQPFYSAEQFGQRMQEHFHEPNFTLATGRLAGQLVAFAYGASMPADTWWWQHLQGVDDPDLARETGTRTFWFREILVRTQYQGRGYAHQLHNAILQPRPEERAALFVRKDNPARLTYLKWGWYTVGHLPSQNGSPEFDAMLLNLRTR